MERKESIPPLVLQSTLFPEAPYSGVINNLRKMLPTSMEIQSDGEARLPVFSVDGYDVSICPGPGFSPNLSKGPGYCWVDNPWYKPLEEVVRERQQQPLIIAGITCEGSRELSLSRFEDLLAMLHKGRGAALEISNSIQLIVKPDGGKEVHSAFIQGRILYPFLASIGMMYSTTQEDSAMKASERRPRLRLFYNNHALETGGQTPGQDLQTFEAVFSTLVNS